MFLEDNSFDDDLENIDLDAQQQTNQKEIAEDFDDFDIDLKQNTQPQQYQHNNNQNLFNGRQNNNNYIQDNKISQSQFNYQNNQNNFNMSQNNFNYNQSNYNNNSDANTFNQSINKILNNNGANNNSNKNFNYYNQNNQNNNNVENVKLNFQYEPGYKKKNSSALPQLTATMNTVKMSQELNIKDYQRVSKQETTNNFAQFQTENELAEKQRQQQIQQQKQQEEERQNQLRLQQQQQQPSMQEQQAQQNQSIKTEQNEQIEPELMQLEGVHSELQEKQIDFNNNDHNKNSDFKRKNTWNETDNEEEEQKEQKQQKQEEEKEEEKEGSEESLNELVVVDNLQIDNMQEFLTQPLQKGVILQCTIKRDKSGLSNKFYPKYHVGLSNGFKYLMSGKKKGFNKSSNYCISLNQQDPGKQDDNYLGKVRSNFLGTEFNIYDCGKNPKKARNLQSIRHQLGVVVYQANFMGTKGPRKMQVLLPKTGSQFKPINEKDGMLTQFKNGNMKDIMYLVNKTPQWNEKAQAFVLNFKGRVDQPSVKNFQLIEKNNEKDIYLQFGRLNNELFNMDFQYPLSPLQAFAICLSSFDNKLACE